MRVKEIVWENEITEEGENETNQKVLNNFIKKIEKDGYLVKDIKYRITDKYSHTLIVFQKKKSINGSTKSSNADDPVNVEEEVDEEWE